MGKKNSNPIPRPALSRPAKKIPKLREVPPKTQWTFSFQYWNQIDCFGLKCEKVDFHWFIALIRRFSALSQTTVDDVIQKQDWWRLHPIDWNAKSIPIKKAEINWLPSDISLDEIEVLQFQISDDSGRVHGFFDHRNVFCVLLLDPMHNLQPSKATNYKVRPSAVLPSRYDLLIASIVNIREALNKQPPLDTTTIKDKLSSCLNLNSTTKFVCIDQQTQNDLDQLWNLNSYESIDDIIFEALLDLFEKKGISQSN